MLVVHVHVRIRPGQAEDFLAATLVNARASLGEPGVLRFDEIGGDIVRPGIMLYGASPFPYDTAEMLGLQPVMTLRSEIIDIQELRAQDAVGYGGTYISEAPLPPVPAQLNGASAAAHRGGGGRRAK